MMTKCLALIITQQVYHHLVGVPEWLSGMTRNHVGFARAGSNPAAHAFFFLLYISCTMVNFLKEIIGFFISHTRGSSGTVQIKDKRR